MARITIDGKVCTFEGRKTILEVAKENGIEIPHFCWHPALRCTASCRICLAEVAQPNPRNGNKLERIPKLLPTCQSPAVDGAEVYTNSDKAVANRKAVMEYLLLNHPLDCPVCDQAGECYLQDYSYRYGRGHSRFVDTKLKQPKKDLGPHVYLYSDRCIMCTRCVRFTREVTGTAELCVEGRGSVEQIDLFPGKALDNPLSVNVVDLCPVGALLDKDFLFARRVWELTSTPGIDGLTSGGDNLWIDHAEGQVYRFRPRYNGQVNGYWISDEVRYAWHRVFRVERLTGPRVRQVGPVDWNRGLEKAVSVMRSAVEGGQRLAAVLSPMLTCEDAWHLARAVRALDGSALLGVGPVPVEGQDRSFPGGYTVRAEKAPNARGVRRVLERVVGEGAVLEYEQWAERLDGEKVGAVLVTGNYPTTGPCDRMVEVLGDRPVVLLDTQAGRLAERAEVVLATAAWVEKAGTFENCQGRLQAFERAVRPVDFARAEAQVGLDLLACAGAGSSRQYDAAATRAEMGGVFVEQVHLPDGDRRPPMPVEYVAL